VSSTKTARLYGTVNARKALGVREWQLDALVRHRQLAPPDDDGKWAVEQIDALKERLPEALAVIGEQRPIGPAKCAALLAKTLGLFVTRDDIEEMKRRDLLPQARSARGKTLDYKGFPLFDAVQVAAIGTEFRDLVTQLVADRVHWLGRSLSLQEAVDLHGMDFHRLGSEQDIGYGWLQRFASADVEAVKAGQDPRTWGSPDRLISADEAATRLRCRRIELDHCIAAGLLTPAGHEDVAVSRTATCPVPLYRAADVDSLTTKVDAAWDRFRWASWQDPVSRLRHLADRPGVRDPQVRPFVEELQKRLDRGFFVELTDRIEWRLEWNHRGLAPTDADVRHEIESDPRVRHLSDRIVFAAR
jgi:hypothetical protein